ncbi:uncharacterized protein LOC119735346 [Patiria miniata]|uniref:Uncharacterized protein n=1 Tax=Patiria miniata TaxID=46514 RepID=A0A914ALS6_PATMI|nr:uncharacterized protein LOC119735346 [Patiria miniata]
MPRKSGKSPTEQQGVSAGKSVSVPQTPTMPTLRPAEGPDSPADLPQMITSTPRSDDTDFQVFVRKSLTDLHRGQADINRRITQLESNLSESIQFESRRISDLEEKVKELEGMRQHIQTIDQQLADHNDSLNKLERFSRRNNVRVIGLPQDKDEECLELTKRLLRDKFGLSDIKIERAHRDGPKIPGKPQHLLFKLNCYQDKLEILRRQRQALSDESYFCVEDLTKQDLKEKRRWKDDVRKAYQAGKKYRFYAGKWRGSGGVPYVFPQQ